MQSSRDTKSRNPAEIRYFGIGPKSLQAPSPTTPPIKSYAISGRLDLNRFITIKHSDRPFLWCHIQNSHRFLPNQIRLTQGSETGSFVATIKMQSKFGGCPVLLAANPDTASKEQWRIWPAQKKWKFWQIGQFAVWHQGQKYLWKWTARKAGRFVGKWVDYQFWSPQGKILATCTWEYDRIDFFEDLGDELELWCLLGILAMEYKNIRRGQYRPSNYNGP